MSTKSKRHELSVAADLSGDRRALSGAGAEKLDVCSDDFLVDCKTTEGRRRKDGSLKKSYTVTVDEWENTRHHATMEGKIPLMVHRVEGEIEIAELELHDLVGFIEEKNYWRAQAEKWKQKAKQRAARIVVLKACMARSKSK